MVALQRALEAWINYVARYIVETSTGVADPDYVALTHQAATHSSGKALHDEVADIIATLDTKARELCEKHGFKVANAWFIDGPRCHDLALGAAPCTGFTNGENVVVEWTKRFMSLEMTDIAIAVSRLLLVRPIHFHLSS